jgi:GxxExxY protein
MIYPRESFEIIGICMKIHSELGPGLKEVNYKDALEIDLIETNISFEREKYYRVKYKGQVLRHPYVADFLVFDSIILEIKAASKIVDSFISQAIGYLAVSSIKLALIINFGEKSLTFKRIVL